MKPEASVSRLSSKRWTLLLFALASVVLSIYHSATKVDEPYLNIHNKESELSTDQIDDEETTHTSKKATFSPFEVQALAVEIKEGNNHQCSCMNPLARGKCCTRRLHKTHKMGSALTRILLHNCSRIECGGIERVTDTYLYPTQKNLNVTDYRDVVLVRNIYEALESGYLYHRSGRECWFDHQGEPWSKEGTFAMLHWTQQTYRSYVPYPPAEGRILCKYMEEESTRAGMQAYIAWVLGTHYQGIPDQWEVAQLHAEYGRTLFVCFEELTNPKTERIALDRMVNFWFPGSNMTWTGPRTATDVEYHGGHSTTHDIDVRTGLRKVIEELDQTFFEGWVSKFDAMLPCQ